MSDNSDPLDRHIAALEDALALPLPDTSRAQLEQQLRALQARRAVQGAHSEGHADVSGTLHGAAVGVNLGTVQTYYGGAPPAPSAQPAAEVSQEDIADQRELLDAHRRTLAVYLKQQAQLGSAHAPPGVANGIREARAAIHRVKATLRGWNVAVADHPDDDPTSP